MPTVFEEFNRLKQALAHRYDDREAGNIARYAMEDLFGFMNAHHASEKPFPEELRGDWDNACARLSAGEPLQYVTGKAFFYGLELAARPGALIPRPETEELVEWVVFDLQKQDKPSILDIGTGSGCIAIALKKNIPSAVVSATDISPEALSIAAENAAHCQTEINFFQHDVLNEELPGRWDVLVSNPPYISSSEASDLAEHVVAHEPHLALFAPGPDPLVFYRAIAEKAKTALNPGGSIYVEIHAHHARQTMNVFQSAGYREVDMKKDLDGKWRMISCKL